MTVLDPGDDSVVLHLSVRLLPAGESALAHEGPGHACQFVQDPDGAWNLLLSLERPGGHRHYAWLVRPDCSPGRRSDGRLVWSVARSSGGTVRLTPSLYVPGDLHAVVTVTDAAKAPPWRPEQET